MNKKALKELSRRARERELEFERLALQTHYQALHGGLEGFEQSALYRKYRDIVCKQIDAYYQHVELELTVAKAVARGILTRDELPEAVLQQLAATIDYYHQTSEALRRCRQPQ